MKTDTKTKSSAKNRILASVTGVQTPNVTRENIDLKDLRSKWIPFFKGSKNVWINDLALRKRRSATHGAVLESKVTYSIGKKLLFTQDNEAVELNDSQKA